MWEASCISIWMLSQWEMLGVKGTEEVQTMQPERALLNFDSQKPAEKWGFKRGMALRQFPSEEAGVHW